MRFVDSASVLRLWRGNNTSVDYRGEATAIPTGGSPGSVTSVTTVLSLPLEQYLRGTVPRESPASWPADALRAQAVAARTYAARAIQASVGKKWDICDTTSCQVFGGTTAYSASGSPTAQEYASTDTAIQETAGVALTYNGSPAFLEYSSSNGGWSTAGSAPYLIARADAWDGTAPGDPVHSWTAKLRVSDLEAKFPSIGSFSRLVVTQRDGNGEWGGRVLAVRVEGTAGSVNATGYDVMNSHAYPSFSDGLRSNWWAMPDTHSPIGSLDVAQWTGSSIHVGGWTLDPDSSSPISVHAYLDGGFAGQFVANGSRPDVGSAYPVYGNDHGFDFGVAASPGTHQLCVYAINIGAGSTNTQLGCRQVRVPPSDPVGALDGTPVAGASIRVGGWALDQDTVDPIAVHAYMDGSFVGQWVANLTRPDVGAAYPGYGNQHGYNFGFMAPAGSHQICVYAINVGAGSTNTPLGCRQVSVTADPVGALDGVPVAGAFARAGGWTLDPDSSSPIAVHAYLDGGFVGQWIADQPRPDVGAAYPVYGNDHGFNFGFKVPAGSHQVCVYAINVGGGTINTGLGCRQVVVTADPVGSLDVVERVGTRIHVGGWTLDSDTSSAIMVHTYVDGQFLGQWTANGSRTDIGAAYPVYGNDHGFDFVADLSAGPHQVCVYAINVGGGSVNTPLGCRSV